MPSFLSILNYYFRSNNARVAAWLEVPDSRFLLEFVRPDFLMLRTLAKGLILWDTIMPDFEWIQSHVPASMRSHCLGMARLSIFGSLLPCIFVVNLALNLEQSLLKLFFKFYHAI